MSGLRRVVIRYRRAWLVAAACVLSFFVPYPGYFVAALFWPTGVHELDSTTEGVMFLATVYVASAAVWAAVANWLLPRDRELRER